MKTIKLLFLCTGNSCRSQMAEGWTRFLKGNQIDVYSAGIETHGLNPHAVKVMAEAGVDISSHTSQLADEFKEITFDAVVTVCGHAAEHCPVYLGRGKKIHQGFDDPPAMAKDIAARGGSAEEQLECYRRVRDEIRSFVETLPGSLGLGGSDE